MMERKGDAMKLLLAIDGSTTSRTALDEVIARPWPAGTRVEVLHVVEPAHLWTMSVTAEELARRSEDLLTGAVAQLRAGGLEADRVLLHGDPKRAILDRAAHAGADLVVVGSHGSAATRFVLGNVAAAVVRYAPCSVEIVRGPARAGARKVLLAADGSAGSEAAAHSIAARPWPAGTEVRVLSVVELVLPPVIALLEPPFIHSAQVEELRGEAMKRAEDAVASACGIVAVTCTNVSQSISVLLDGPRRVILDEAAQWGADLVVLGSHGHRGMDRFLLGSVSETVATHAHCSVEVIRQHA
jgi:nucleotide-binding universal stress UspA family protein